MNNYEKCGYYSDDECNICGMGMSGKDTWIDCEKWKYLQEVE